MTGIKRHLFAEYKHKLLGAVGSSCVYLTVKRDDRSCLEVDLRNTIDFVPAVVKTQLAFVMSGSEKQGDCVDALGRLEKWCTALERS